MLDSNSIVGEAVEQLGSTVKSAVSQTVKAPVDLGKTAVSQIANSWQDKPEHASSKQLVSASVTNTRQNHVSSKNNNRISAATKTDQIKLNAVRANLHSEYYKNLLTGLNPNSDIASGQEEGKGQKVLPAIEDKKKSLSPLAVQRSRNKTEAFRGASG